MSDWTPKRRAVRKAILDHVEPGKEVRLSARWKSAALQPALAIASESTVRKVLDLLCEVRPHDGHALFSSYRWGSSTRWARRTEEDNEKARLRVEKRTALQSLTDALNKAGVQCHVDYSSRPTLYLNRAEDCSKLQLLVEGATARSTPSCPLGEGYMQALKDGSKDV